MAPREGSGAERSIGAAREAAPVPRTIAVERRRNTHMLREVTFS